MTERDEDFLFGLACMTAIAVISIVAMALFASHVYDAPREKQRGADCARGMAE